MLNHTTAIIHFILERLLVTIDFAGWSALSAFITTRSSGFLWLKTAFHVCAAKTIINWKSFSVAEKLWSAKCRASKTHSRSQWIFMTLWRLCASIVRVFFNCFKHSAGSHKFHVCFMHLHDVAESNNNKQQWYQNQRWEIIYDMKICDAWAGEKVAHKWVLLRKWISLISFRRIWFMRSWLYWRLWLSAIAGSSLKIFGSSFATWTM